MTITTARVVLIGVTMTMIAVFASGVFDVAVPLLLLAAVIPCAVALAMVGRQGRLRFAAALGAVVGSVLLVVLLEGGSLSDVADAFVAGPRRLLSTDWPSPVRPDLVGTMAVLVSTLTALSCELASRPRLHLLPLAPAAVGYAVITALAAPLIRPWWLLAFLVACAAFALLHPGGTLAHRLTFLRGERRLAPMLGLTLGLTAVLSVPLAFSARADPRDNEPPEQTASILDPIEATLALRQIDPPIPVHSIETESAIIPTHWRTAALDRYTGRRWSPELTLRPIGRTLGAADGDTIDYTVRFIDDSIDLLPLPGAPLRVDTLVDTDPERTIVRVVDVEAGDDVEVRAALPSTSSRIAEGPLGNRQIDETVAGLTDLAETTAGDGTLREQLDEIERTMREEYLLQPDVPGGGLQQRLIERFLQEKRGNEEQFATGFVLLVRSLGIDARVATGFVIEPDATSTAQVLQSDDAAIWPEVLINGEWVAYDPVPEDVYRPATPEPEIRRTQTPAAPQPPIDPPPDPGVDDEDDDELDEDEAAPSGGGLPAWAVAVGAGVGVIVLPIALVVLAILAVKRRRRRRRLRAAAAGDRVRGAWATATDGLVDAGVALRSSRTDQEIAAAGHAAARGASSDLSRLAALSSAVSYGSPERTDQMADDAVVCLGVIEDALVDGRTRWQRIRWRLSLRSLRKRSASPVTA